MLWYLLLAAVYSSKLGNVITDPRAFQINIATSDDNRTYNKSDEFTVGSVFYLSNSTSNLSNLAGIQEAEALRCAVENLGDPVFYNIQDSFGDVSKALRQGLDQSSTVFAGIGPSNPADALDMAALYSDLDIPLISYSATNTFFGNSTGNETFFRLIGNDSVTMKGITNLMKDLDFTLVSALFSDDDAGQSGNTAFRTQANEQLLTLTCTAFISVQDDLTGRLNGQINCLSNSQANVVFLFMDQPLAAQVLEEFSKSDALQDLLFIGVDRWANFYNFERFSQNLFPGSYLEGSLSLLPKQFTSQTFEDCFRRLNPFNTTYNAFRLFWQEFFKCSLENSQLPFCSPNISRRKLVLDQNYDCKCNGQENISDVPIIGRVSYVEDAVALLVRALDSIQNNCQNYFSAEKCNESTFTGSDLAFVLRNTALQGKTGRIQFDDTEERIGTEYEVFQANANGEFVKIGEWNSLFNSSQLETENLRYKNNEKPISKITPDTVLVTNNIFAALIVVLCVLQILLCIGFMIYFFIKRKEKVVKKTSPVFVQLMLFGIIMVNVSLIIWSFESTQLFCITKVWIGAIGFALIMGNLLAKTYRIFKIFTNVRVSSVAITDADLLKFSGGIILFEVLLLSIYTFAKGLPDAVLKDSTTQTLYRFISCEVSDSSFQTIMTIAILVINALFVLFGVVIAYLTRNVDSSFNESKYIALTMYVYLLSGLIFLAIYFTSGDGSGSVFRQYLARSLGGVIAMIFTIASLFGPKLAAVIKEQQSSSKKTSSEGSRIRDLSTTTSSLSH